MILTGGAGPDDFIPRLTDFGLAKLLEEAGDDTRSGVRIGTPAYMAPEQAASGRGDVGPAADIYALGATLYEIMTGRPPFRGETEAETLHLVIDAEPVALRALRPGLPRDLDTICLKCLRKEPSRRYASAAALADDLKRLLDGRPIVGLPVSSWERACGWGRRRPAVAVLLALVVVMASGLSGGAARWSAQLRWHNEHLKEEIVRADQLARETKKQTQIAEVRRLQANRVHYAESLRLARRALESRQIELAQDVLHDIQPGPDGVDPRGFAWHYLWLMAHREFSQLWGHDSTVLSSVVSLDGKTPATQDLRGTVMVWGLAPDMELDKPRAILSTPRFAPGELYLSPDGLLLARLDAPASRREIDIFETTQGRPVGRLNLDGRLEGSYGHRRDACFRSGRTRDRLGEPGFGKARACQLDPLGRHLPQEDREPGGPHQLGSFCRLQSGRPLAGVRKRRSDCADLERRGEDHRGRADWAHQESYVCRIQPRREDARDSIERRVGPALGRCHAASTGNLARYGKHAGGQVCARRLASGLGQ